MIGNNWKSALALGAVLAASGSVSADDRDTLRTVGGSSSTTMTLGGKGTAEQAAGEDNEDAGYRGGYGGYYGGYRGGYGYGGYRGGYGWGGNNFYRGGWGGGWGGNNFYRGGWGGGYYNSFYRGGFGGYYGGYRGYYNSFSYYRPAYYPVYSSYYSDCGPSIYFGIGGNAVSLGAPTVTLGASMARPVPQPMEAPGVPGDGTFRYDGGPANPVPLPKAEPQPIPPAGTSASNDLPVSLKPKAATSPYKYKAYGEK